MVCLLDVNVLLAICDNFHTHHDAAHLWFARVKNRRWATCPITENGFLRILGNPAYPNYPGSPYAAVEMLRQIRSIAGHQFWPDSHSILDWISAGTSISSGHVTDLYLLGLAAAKQGKLATFDRKIPVQSVVGGPEAVELLG